MASALAGSAWRTSQVSRQGVGMNKRCAVGDPDLV
jgi:hypothetical protein